VDFPAQRGSRKVHSYSCFSDPCFAPVWVGTILDTAHADRVLAPAGNNGVVVYQVAKNGATKMKTVLIDLLE